MSEEIGESNRWENAVPLLAAARIEQLEAERDTWEKRFYREQERKRDVKAERDKLLDDYAELMKNGCPNCGYPWADDRTRE